MDYTICTENLRSYKQYFLFWTTSQDLQSGNSCQPFRAPFPIFSSLFLLLFSFFLFSRPFLNLKTTIVQARETFALVKLVNVPLNLRNIFNSTLTTYTSTSLTRHFRLLYLSCVCYLQRYLYTRIYVYDSHCERRFLIVSLNTTFYTLERSLLVLIVSFSSFPFSLKFSEFTYGFLFSFHCIVFSLFRDESTIIIGPCFFIKKKCDKLAQLISFIVGSHDERLLS